MSVQQQKNQVSDTKKQKSFRSRLKAQAKAAPSDVYSISHSGGGAKTMTCVCLQLLRLYRLA